MGLLITLLALVTVAVVIHALAAGWQRSSPQAIELILAGRDS